MSVAILGVGQPLNRRPRREEQRTRRTRTKQEQYRGSRGVQHFRCEERTGKLEVKKKNESRNSKEEEEKYSSFRREKTT